MLVDPPQEDADLVPLALALALVLLDALVVLLDVDAATDALVVPEDLPVLAAVRLALAAALPALAAAPTAALALPAVIVVDQTAVIDPPAPHNVAVLSVLLTDVAQEAKILQEMSKWNLYKIYFISNQSMYKNSQSLNHTTTTTHAHSEKKPHFYNLIYNMLSQPKYNSQSIRKMTSNYINFYQIKMNMLSFHLASLPQLHFKMPIVYSFENGDALSSGLNSFVEKVSRDAIAQHGHLSIAISGGSLPKILSKELAYNKNVEFDKWHIFWADERCVSHDDPDSNYLEVKKSLLDHIPQIPQENIYPINQAYAVAKDAENAATEYEQQLKKFFKNELPRFDLLLLGMGPDGHCCSLFPGHPLLNEHTRWVAPITDSPKPPPERITLTYPVVNNSQLVVFVTAGDGKKDMVQQIIEQPDKDLPCQRVKPVGKVYWFIDHAAAAKLRKESCSEYKL